MYFVMAGTIEMVSPSGRLLCRLSTGDCFGGRSCLEGGPLVVSARAASPTALLRLNKDALLSACAASDDFHFELVAMAELRDSARPPTPFRSCPPPLGKADWAAVRDDTGGNYEHLHNTMFNRYGSCRIHRQRLHHFHSLLFRLLPCRHRILEAVHYKPAPTDLSSIVLPADVQPLTEFISQNTHEVWATERIKRGWRWGPSRDNRKKLHPDLIPYEELTDSCKQYAAVWCCCCFVDTFIDQTICAQI